MVFFRRETTRVLSIRLLVLAITLYSLIFCLNINKSTVLSDQSDLYGVPNIHKISVDPSDGRFKRATGVQETSIPRHHSTTKKPSKRLTTTRRIARTVQSTRSTHQSANLILWMNSTTTHVPVSNSTTTHVPISNTTTTHIPISNTTTTHIPISNTTSLLTSRTAHFDARDVTYFLESHPAHSMYDPRAYFTEERTTRSLTIMLNELDKLPNKLRFAFVVRVFNELGRKIASKLNYYSAEVAAILRKTPDDLGNKPEVSMLVDVINGAFESKEDLDPREETGRNSTSENPISSLIESDKEKAAVFNASQIEIATRLGHIITHFALTASKSSLKIEPDKRVAMARLLGEAMHMGSKTMIDELSKNDKFRVPDEVVNFCYKIFKMARDIFDRHMKDNDASVGEQVLNSFKANSGKSFKDLNPISDKTGLVGPWNNYLFTNLGTTERVVKLFAALLSRVPPEAKSRWINMYIAQVHAELERTLSGFVIMQGMPHNNNMSQLFLLDPSRSVDIMPMKLPKPRTNYLADKNRIPARCYLAGRRLRFVLLRAMKGYGGSNEVISAIAGKIAKLKLKLVRQSGNEIYRLCMPRLEVGLHGWGINGDPEANGGQSNKFPLKSPIEDLELMDDPFVSGVKLGYRVGVKVGYNEERNATLEMERASRGTGSFVEKAKFEVDSLGKASYRRAATVAAKRALEIAIREGYTTTLKISIRAGMLIPAETGSQLASLRCVSFAGQVGTETGRSVVDSYLAGKELSEKERESYVKVGETYGLLAGQIMGRSVGAIVGKEAAEEAYKRAIIRGGKVSRAKFHLDEYESGAKLGFEYGLKEGKRIASSSTLDPSAPKFFRLPMPAFSASDKNDNEVDHWEKDLIPALNNKAIDDLRVLRNHTSVSGSLKGVYTMAKEIKKGLKRVSYSNMSYNIEVFANGFIMNDVAYLKLNATVNKMGALHGSLIAADISNEYKDS